MQSWTSPEATRVSGDRDAAEFVGKVLLVVGTGKPTRRSVFERVHALGLAVVIGLHDEINWAAPYIDAWILADPTDPDAALAAFLSHQANPAAPRIDGVITFDEFSVQAAAAIAEHHQVVGNSRAVVERVRNKLTFRQFCKIHGLPTTPAVSIDGTTAACLARVRAGDLKYPLMLKPQSGGGSAMVSKVADETALAAAIDDYLKGLGADRFGSGWGNAAAFVEEFLDGPEVDIDMLLQAGKVLYCEVSDNFGASGPYFLETGGCFPSSLADVTQASLREMAIHVVAALGIQNGCIHFEAKVTPTGPVPIEINLRLGGAEVYTFHRAVRGIDLAAEAVRIALGVPVSPQWAPLPLSYLASTNFVPSHAGTVRAIGIDPRLWQSEALVEIVIFDEVGMEVKLPPDEFKCLGWLVASGKNVAEARHQLAELTNWVTFTL